MNVLVYSHRSDDRGHAATRDCIERLVNGTEPFGLSVLVAVVFLRIVTNPRIFPLPTPSAVALAAVDQLVGHPRCRLFAPREDHWKRVSDLCRATGASGKLVADAQHAAVAMSAGCT